MMNMCQRELKERAAVFYRTNIEAMDLPYDAWAVLRDNMLRILGELEN